jgi:hypothetical protein
MVGVLKPVIAQTVSMRSSISQSEPASKVLAGLLSTPRSSLTVFVVSSLTAASSIKCLHGERHGGS